MIFSSRKASQQLLNSSLNEETYVVHVRKLLSKTQLRCYLFQWHISNCSNGLPAFTDLDSDFVSAGSVYDWNLNPTLCSVKSTVWYNVTFCLQSELESESVSECGNVNKPKQYVDVFVGCRHLNFRIPVPRGRFTHNLK